MRRKTAIRLSVTIDRDLAQWLDGYAHDERTTKSVIIEELVRSLFDIKLFDSITGEGSEEEGR